MLKSVVLFVASVVPLCVQAQSRIDVQEAAVNAVLAMDAHQDASSRLGTVLSASYSRIAEIRDMLEQIENLERRTILQSSLDAIVSRVDFTLTQLTANRTRYWNTGMTEYNNGCLAEVADRRTEAIRNFNASEVLFKSGKADAEALLLDAELDLAALNALACHQFFYDTSPED